MDVPFDKLMCGKHWRMVPRETQSLVYNTFRRRVREPEAHREAMAKAIREVNARLAGR